MNKQKIKQMFKEKRTMKFTILSLIVISSIFIAYSFGYIPICLSVKPPIGNIGEVHIEQYRERYPELSDVPSLEKIVYKVFGTDESLNSVLNNYEEELKNDGYTLKYKGTGYTTGENFVYIGYLKGLTDEAYEDFNYETIVLYMTGNAFDFVSLLEWYQEKYDPGAFF